MVGKILLSSMPLLAPVLARRIPGGAVLAPLARVANAMRKALPGINPPPARKEFEERRGPNFSYAPLLGDRTPPLDYRK